MSANAESLETLVSMGFESSAARIALEATLNDFDAAVALLGSPQPSRAAVDVGQINQVKLFAFCCEIMRQIITRTDQ
jgi:hypothetical protein